MSNYPNLLDTILTLPTVSGSGQDEVAINALQEAVIAVETELGIKPSFPYSNVRVRLDILESRINFGVSPSIPNDGYVKSPLYIWNVPSNLILSISDGYGAPTESRLNGSLYMRGDGYANNDFYIRRDGYWVPIQTEEWVAAGDLSGNHLSQKVIGIRTKSLDVSLESVGATQDGYHLTWDNADGYWRAETGFIAGSDLAIDSPRFGRTGQKVIRFQNRTFAATAPVGTTATDGSSIKWNSVQNQWEPQAAPMIFVGSVNANDGYTTRTNISSNKALQSPMSAVTSKVGMINLGSRSTGATTGTTDNYAAILGGDQNTSSIQFGLVVGGQLNVSSTGLYATVVNGTTNTASNTYAAVLDGYSNIASAVNALIGNGGTNQANAQFSTVLNGLLNTIATSNVYASILAGSSNTITGAAATYSVIVGGSGNTTNAQNVFLGTPTGANVQSNYGFVGTGINNTISTTSNHSAIVSGTTNAISAASSFAFIGAGNNITVTGLYGTVLNATVATVNGLHSTILNGNTNSVTATFSTVVNGNNNTISGNPAYATIVDGYSHTITANGGLIVDGYSNTVSGIWSSILNGNGNSIAGRNSTILNGSANILDANSTENTILVGTANNHINSSNTVVIGSGNTLTNVSSHFVLGNFNDTQSSLSFINGSSNIAGSGTTMTRIFGSNNTIGININATHIFGNANNLVNATAINNINGSNNIVDGYSSSSISGSSNLVNSNLSNIHGQFGKTRLFGQEVRANSRFTSTTIAVGSNGAVLPQATINVVSTTGFPASGSIYVVSSKGSQAVTYSGTTGTSFTGCSGGTGSISTGGLVGKIGEAQWSRLLLTGAANSGASIPLQLQDTSPVNVTFVDGYSYDMNVRVMIVNTSGATAYPARFTFDVLAHQAGGVLVLDNVNQSISTPNTSDDPTGATRTVGWSVSITASTNQILITVDPELDATNYILGAGPSNRRAIATIEMREMSRT